MELTGVEIAAAVAVVGSLLAVAVPAAGRNLHASHLVEATDGVARLTAGAVALTNDAHGVVATAPLTPAEVPRGQAVVDATGVWDHPSWQALAFRPAAEGLAHRYSFAVDASGADVVLRAVGDLDGDGITSIFEGRVRIEGGVARAAPGLYVESELE